MYVYSIQYIYRYKYNYNPRRRTTHTQNTSTLHSYFITGYRPLYAVTYYHCTTLHYITLHRIALYHITSQYSPEKYSDTHKMHLQCIPLHYHNITYDYHNITDVCSTCCGSATPWSSKRSFLEAGDGENFLKAFRQRW